MTIFEQPDPQIAQTKRAIIHLQIAAAKSVREAVRVVVEAWRRVRR